MIVQFYAYGKQLNRFTELNIAQAEFALNVICTSSYIINAVPTHSKTRLKFISANRKELTLKHSKSRLKKRHEVSSLDVEISEMIHKSSKHLGPVLNNLHFI